jgi:hypothetical protein
MLSGIEVEKKHKIESSEKEAVGVIGLPSKSLKEIG